MANYIIYSTASEAEAKAMQEGEAIGLPFFLDSSSSIKFASVPFVTLDDEIALEVTGYTTLTEDEQSRIVTEVNSPILN